MSIIEIRQPPPMDTALQDLDTGTNLHQTKPVALGLSFLNSLALVVGLQIGSGVFSAPSQVSLHVFSPGEGLVVWLSAGILAWTGAASFIELGLAVPRNGGMQEYLQFCYGDYAGFLFTWIWVTITKPSANAVIATVLADYLSSVIFPFEVTPLPLSKLVAVLAVIIITIVNCLGSKASANVANVFLALKLLLVVSIVSLGVSICGRNGKGVPSSGLGWFEGTDPEESVGLWSRAGELVTALLGALFCYGGWESMGFVVGDMKNSERNLSRVLNSAMMMTISSFVLVVFAFYLCLPIDDIRAKTTLAVEFGNQVLGPLGSKIYAIAISISALGALNVNIFASTKLCIAASERGYFPAILANHAFESNEDEIEHQQEAIKKYPSWIQSGASSFARITANLRLKRDIPVLAILPNAFLSILYIIFGTFNGLVVFVGLSEYLIFFFCVFGVFIIRARRKRNSEPQTYHTWTINPIVFTSLSFLLVLRGVIANALQGVAILVVLVLGWIFFSWRFPKTHTFQPLLSDDPMVTS